jgi:hypothetical protein
MALYSYTSFAFLLQTFAYIAYMRYERQYAVDAINVKTRLCSQGIDFRERQ